MYKFIKTHDEDNQYDVSDVEITIKYNDVDLTKLTETFVEFLRACSFSIPPTQSLELVDENDYLPPEPLEPDDNADIIIGDENN